MAASYGNGEGWLRTLVIDGAAGTGHHAVMDTWPLMGVAAVFALAGAVKGVTGMGLPTVAMSLLGLWLTPLQAAALLIAPSLATNIAQCRGPHLCRLAARLWPGWLAIVLVTVAAPGLGGAFNAKTARQALGTLLIAYGTWGLWRPSLPDLSRRGKAWSAVAGAATGLVTAATGVFVLPWVPYLQSLRLGKDEMIQALGLSFTVATVALGVRVQVAGSEWGWSRSGMALAAVALGAAFAGLLCGERLRRRLAGPAFQRALYLVFVALGVANAARGG